MNDELFVIRIQRIVKTEYYELRSVYLESDGSCYYPLIDLSIGEAVFECDSLKDGLSYLQLLTRYKKNLHDNQQ